MAETPGAKVRIPKGHRLLLTGAALAAGVVTYVIVRSATFSGAFDTALTIFLAVCFASMGVLKFWIAVTGFLPELLRARLTPWNGRA